MTNDTEDRALVEHRAESGWLMAPDTVKEHFAYLLGYKAIMAEGEDYGVIPGTEKPTLYQPGADTLCRAGGLIAGAPKVVEAVRDWEKPFFYFEVAQPVYRADDPQQVWWGYGSCNSRENKYAWRWVPVFKLSDSDKERAHVEGWARETRRAKSGKDFVWYRAPNDDIYSLVNTIQKMAIKRAYVSATLRATGAHRVFTQDLEDMQQGPPADDPNTVDAPAVRVVTPEEALWSRAALNQAVKAVLDHAKTLSLKSYKEIFEWLGVEGKASAAGLNDAWFKPAAALGISAERAGDIAIDALAGVKAELGKNGGSLTDAVSAVDPLGQLRREAGAQADSDGPPDAEEGQVREAGDDDSLAGTEPAQVPLNV